MLADLKAKAVNYGGIVRECCYGNLRYYWADTYQPLSYHEQITFENTFTRRTRAVNNAFAQGTVIVEYNSEFETGDSYQIGYTTCQTYMPIPAKRQRTAWRIPRLRR